jgi:hypothetical protein
MLFSKTGSKMNRKMFSPWSDLLLSFNTRKNILLSGTMMEVMNVLRALVLQTHTQNV